MDSIANSSDLFKLSNKYSFDVVCVNFFQRTNKKVLPPNGYEDEWKNCVGREEKCCLWMGSIQNID